MKNHQLLLATVLPLSTGAFMVSQTTSSPSTKAHSNPPHQDDFSAFTTTDSRDDIEFSSPYNKNEVIMSPAIPFMECPKVLVDCDLAGNAGFDPFGFAQTQEQLYEYREAEVKHARLAMLAAAGWPISELLDRQIAEYFGMDSLLDAYDRAPSMLNGGLERVSPVWWGACFGMTAAIDLFGISKARSGDPDYIPGKLGFDPLNLYPPDTAGQKRMELAEIKHGRLAMVAVAIYFIEESVTNLGIIDETPFFFFPLPEALERMAA